MDREAPLAAIAGCRRCSLARKSSKIKALAGMFGLPDARNKTFRPCHVRSVFVAKLLEHHPLLRADSKREEDSKCDHVRRTCHPIRDDERVGNGIEHQRRGHRVANPAIDALRDESMLLA